MEKWYGLLYVPEGALVGFRVMANPEDGECCDVQFILERPKYGSNVWLVKSFNTAEKARTTNTEWYNAGYETPTNQFKAEDLKVVEVVLNIHPIVIV